MSLGLRELQTGGFKSLWQGNAVNVLKGTPQSTLQCFIYAQVSTQTCTNIHSHVHRCSNILYVTLLTDEVIHAWREGQSDSPSEVWTGLCVRGCGTCCVLPLRGITVTQQVGVPYCKVLSLKYSM